jgi:hypothetical protein
VARSLDQPYQDLLAALPEQELRRRLADLAEIARQNLIASREQRAREISELVACWLDRWSRAQRAVASMNSYCDAQCPPWDRLAECQSAPLDVRALRFGHWNVDLDAPSDGAAISPSNGQEDAASTVFSLPAVLSYPDCPSLVLEAAGEGRDAAIGVMQNVMLRLLTTFPPGKVRFTIIDPVGLGQNFSAFMHLADYDEGLVTSRIWTVSAHIHQRLADLTEHMEYVIQKYLRNEFASIQGYNEQAGEVAEPLRILVVANFPANFSEEAARRLASIAASGPRCGVLVLLSSDPRLTPPRSFDPADLERQAQTLVWDGERGQFRWKGEALQRWPLTVDLLPATSKRPTSFAASA